MDLSTTPRRATDGLSDLQKTRVAKSVFSIRSLVDVEEAEFPMNEEEIINGESLPSFAFYIDLSILIYRFIYTISSYTYRSSCLVDTRLCGLFVW